MAREPDDNTIPLNLTPEPEASAGPVRPRKDPGVRAAYSAATEPPHGDSRLSTWLLLLIMLIVAVPAMLMEIHQPDVVMPREARTIATSIETWHRLHAMPALRGFSPDNYVPHLNLQPMMSQPPGTTWVHLAAFSTCDPVTTPVDRLVLHARLMSVAYALLTIAAVFWAGHSIGKLPTAAFAALVCASNPLFITYARVATPDMQHCALAMSGIAGALWAIRPLRPVPSTERQFIGWITCGLAIGCATLTAGPITLVTVLAPVFLLILLCPDRLSHLIGLLAALLIGVLLVVPWAMYVHEHDPRAWQAWIASIAPAEQIVLPVLTDRAVNRTLALLAGMIPWTLWLVASVVQPFSRSSQGERTRMLLSWTWLIGLAVLLLPMPTVATMTDVLPLVPASSILIAQLFHQYADRAAAGRYVRSWQLFRWAHALVIAILSIAATAAMHWQHHLTDRGWLPHDMAADMGGLFHLGAALAMIGVVALSLYGVVRHFPGRALVCWAAWSIIFMTTMTVPLTRGEAGQNVVRRDSERLGRFVRGAQTFWLQRDVQAIEPDPVVSLYSETTLPWLRYAQIEQAIVEHRETGGDSPLLLVSSKNLKAPGDPFVNIANLHDAGLRIWRYDPGKPMPAESMP